LTQKKMESLFMTKIVDDTSNPNTLVLENDIPLPKDRRLGTGERLPPELKSVMSSMEVGQSFFMETSEEEQKPKIAAIRASIARYVDSAQSTIDENWVFSVRRENEPFRLGVRVWRMEDKVEQ